MPTLAKARKKLTMQLKAIPFKGTIYELGAGWGTLAFSIARQMPAHPIIGYEISPVPWLISKVLHRLVFPYPNLNLIRGDFFKNSLSQASLVVCYLYPGAMEKLKEKLSKELQPGTYVVSYTFCIPGWAPQSMIEVPDLYRSKIYIYKI